MESPFLLLSVREGREDFAKAEMEMRFLGAKFAFSRPGFLSYKAGKATEMSGGGVLWKFSDTENLIFPLRSALFAGKVSRKDGGPWAESQAIEALPKCRHLHLLDYRDAGLGEESFTRVGNLSDWDAESPGLAKALAPFLKRAGLLKGDDALDADLIANLEASTGEGILQVYRVSDREFWVGVTILRAEEFGLPGGESGIELPAEAPSRAYLKLEEAVRLLERSVNGGKAGGKSIFKRDDRAIEVGCAPGGACYALLERGLRVLGVDRAEMAPIILKNPKFSQVLSSIGSWEVPADLKADWLVVDMNSDPTIAMRETRKLVEQVAPGLKGVFFTLKLNREQYAVSAERLAETTAKDLKLRTYFLKQLPSNHQEFAFFGIR